MRPVRPGKLRNAHVRRLAFPPEGDPAPLETLIAGSASGRRILTWILVLFAGIALLLAVIGIYGVVAYNVAGRTQEVGVRMALGASKGGVLRLVLLQAMTPVAFGIPAGGAASIGSARLLTSLLYGIEPTDALTLCGAALLLALAAVMACAFPTRRAVLINPVTALRCE
jgi:putative ABC transport system permease protein